MRPAVFLDRDGTVNEQMGYINHLSRFCLLPGVGQAIRRLNEARLPVVVVTNQSGLARGYFPLEVLEQVHARMHTELAREGARLDAVYFCPHHPEAQRPEYRAACRCRKPKTGMLEQAALDLGLNLAQSFVVGDRVSDIRTAVNCGATPVLVLTGYGRGDLEYVIPGQQAQPAFVAADLDTAVTWILERQVR